MRTLVYGAYGYTGEQIAREAHDRGLDIVVAGRNGTKTRGLGIELGVEARVFSLEEMPRELDDIDVVLNCAGPFVRTCEPVVEACLETGTSYLDITGEIPVFEALAERDREAEEAGVFLLPGVGFDVVPTDCLACHLHDLLPDATHLRLGVEARPDLSGGTFATIFEHAGGGAHVRRDGTLESVPVASGSRTIDFGNGPKHAGAFPLGDVSTAYYTTGIENIDTYVAVPGAVGAAVRFSQPLAAVLQLEPLKRGLQRLVQSAVDGPSDKARQQNRVSIWGEVTNGDRTVVSRLETPEPYTLTVDAATTALQRLAAMDSHPTGFETPAVVFDAEFVLGLDGVDGFFEQTEQTVPVSTPE